MAIYRLLQQTAFTPEDITLLAEAYEDCLRVLNFPDQPDPKTENIACAVIEIAQTGVRDPVQIRERVVARFGSPAGR